MKINAMIQFSNNTESKFSRRVDYGEYACQYTLPRYVVGSMQADRIPDLPDQGYSSA